MDEAIKLANLLISEISAVESPANLLDGWVVLKQAITGELPVRKNGPLVAWGTDGFALTTEHSDFISICKRNGIRTTILKSALDPERIEPAGVDAGASSSPAPSAVSKHHSHELMRDGQGRFRQSRWRSRTPAQPKFGGHFFV